MNDTDLLKNRAEEINSHRAPKKSFKPIDTSKYLDQATLKSRADDWAKRKGSSKKISTAVPDDVLEKLYTRNERPPIKLNQFKNIFFQNWAKCLKTMPIINPKNKDILHNMSLYFLCDSTSKFQIDKGLFIFGKYGSGKTEMMKAWRITLNECSGDYSNRFQHYGRKKEYLDIKKLLANEGDLGEYDRAHMWIEDIGREERDSEQSRWVKHYGSPIKAGPHFIKHRYEKTYKKGFLTHCTSNYEMDEFNLMYGEGAHSWMKSMFNVVFWHGDDLRK